MPFTVKYNPNVTSPQASIIPDVNARSPGVATPTMLAKILAALTLPLTENLTFTVGDKSISVLPSEDGVGSALRIFAGAAASGKGGALALSGGDPGEGGEQGDVSILATLLFMQGHIRVNDIIGGVFGDALVISSNTIAPTKNFHTVGAGLIKNITSPFDDSVGEGGSITLVPTAAFTYDGTGNILVAAGSPLTAVVNKPMIATYNGNTSKWVMSY